VRKGDDLTTFIVPKVEKIRSLNLPDPQGLAQTCNGKTLPLPFSPDNSPAPQKLLWLFTTAHENVIMKGVIQMTFDL
jgi:hypothetical protein